MSEMVQPVGDEARIGEVRRFMVEISMGMKFGPGVDDYEDRYAVFMVSGGLDALVRWVQPVGGGYVFDKPMQAHGWRLIGDIEYVAGLNVHRGRAEPLNGADSYGVWTTSTPLAREYHHVVAETLATCGARLFGRADVDAPRAVVWTGIPAGRSCPACAALVGLAAGTDTKSGACVHGNTPRPDVAGAAIVECANSDSGTEWGAFSDEGCWYAHDCAVDVANECARENEEAQAPADDPVGTWGRICPAHPGQRADRCEECDAEQPEEE